MYTTCLPVHLKEVINQLGRRSGPNLQNILRSSDRDRHYSDTLKGYFRVNVKIVAEKYAVTARISSELLTIVVIYTANHLHIQPAAM